MHCTNNYYFEPCLLSEFIEKTIYHAWQPPLPSHSLSLSLSLFLHSCMCSPKKCVNLPQCVACPHCGCLNKWMLNPNRRIHAELSCIKFTGITSKLTGVIVRAGCALVLCYQAEGAEPLKWGAQKGPTYWRISLKLFIFCHKL